MRFRKHKTRVLVLSHFLINPMVSGATSTSIKDFFIGKVKEVIQIEQPFPESKHKYGYFVKNKKNEKFEAVRHPVLLAYIIHPFINIQKLLNCKINFDLIIACDNLSYVTAFILKSLGLAKFTIYYSVDYLDNRFDNRFLNYIFHFLDKLAVNNSNETWVVSKKQITARKENGINTKKNKFKIVPIGFPSEKIKINKDINYNLVFAGTFRESAGPELIIEAMPEILKTFPKVKVTFVGNGDEKRLIKIAKRLKVENKIKFFQKIDEHYKFANIISNGSIGIAPYKPIDVSISYTSDPGKIKLYLLCGLPVITTKIATSHTLIEEERAGIAIDYNSNQLVKAVIKILANKSKYMQYKNNAIKLGKQFDPNVIFEKAFST